MEIKNISVIGIGKLGLCTAACFADKGYNVIGVDVNQSVIEAVNSGKSPIYEPGLAELLDRVRGRLSATSDYTHAIENSEVTFIIVPTPSEADGGFSTKYVEESVKGIATGLRKKKNFHIVVLTSTVLPGATNGVVRPLLEKLSGKKCVADFGLCYNPEFIALGSVIRNFTNPDVVLIGESDTRSGERLEKIYTKTCDNNPPVVRMTIENAELAKISLNAYVTLKISFANVLAELCEKLPAGDVDSVTKMLGFDTRIGKKYLSGALGYGGPCFPRDNRAFASVARKFGGEARLAIATDEENKHQCERIVKIVEVELGSLRDRRIAFLGLTYKPDTDVIEESAAVKIAQYLLEKGAKISVYDPAGMKNASKILGLNNVVYADSVANCLKGAEFSILATPWEEFKSLKPEVFIQNMSKPVLLDCWRALRAPQFEKRLRYLAVGVNISK